MAITAGQTALASDFVSTSAGAGDSGKVPKLNSLGKLDASFLKFGGTGADAALTITSGATNIDLGSAAVVTKNYTSISITGTGSLTFTNPHANGTVIVLKSQGNVTFTSSTAPMIAAQATGALGATGGSDFDFSGQGFDGSPGNAGNNFTGWNTGGGGGGIDQSSGGTAGAGGTAISTKIFDLTSIYSGKYPNLVIGGGGGAGGAQMSSGSGQVTSGNGGRGGGALIIECAGALNFTTVSGISVNGTAGTNASFVSGGNATGGGGGGGGGGSCIIFYNALTANSGTITVAGGAGGNGVINASGVLLGSGGGGGSITAGSAGVSSTNPAGGSGGSGVSLVAQNNDFA
jgi:hypothetical protein